jgi:hypothetical protein
MAKKEAPRKELISLLVPFQGNELTRVADWQWLKEYWEYHLPDCEILVGGDPTSRHRWQRRAFSKTHAVNHLFKKSKGDIIVILDADAYLDAKVVTHCAERLRSARRRDVRTWFIPYQHIYRLTFDATAELLETNPAHPLKFSSPPPRYDVQDTHGSGIGRRFGAMCQIMPREAFETVGCMDPRFRGWGGEDCSFMHAVDALWGPHKNTPNDILHLWHSRIQSRSSLSWEIREWEHQENGRTNDWLSSQYNNSIGNAKKMRVLVDEGCRHRCGRWRRFWRWVKKEIFEW